MKRDIEILKNTLFKVYKISTRKLQLTILIILIVLSLKHELLLFETFYFSNNEKMITADC